MEIVVFQINDSFAPETIPMARLAEYLAEYAKILGEVDHVHLKSVTKGSVHMSAVIEEPYIPKVNERLQSFGNAAVFDDIMRAYKRVDEMLAKDNATGRIVDSKGRELVTFQGRLNPTPMVFGPFEQNGSIEGELVRIGGKDDTIHLTLRDGEQIYSGCTTTKELARQLGIYLLGPIIRANGIGKWMRTADGLWEMKSFKINSFEVLDDTPLSEVVNRLREVPGNHWHEVDNPVEELLTNRGGDWKN